MNTYDEKNSQDNLYYSVLIETNEKVGKTKNNRLICVLDRTKNTVINEIIIPYLKNDEFIADGFVLGKNNIVRLKVVTTEKTIGTLLKQEYDNQPDGLFMVLTEKDIIESKELSVDITIKIINEVKDLINDSKTKIIGDVIINNNISKNINNIDKNNDQDKVNIEKVFIVHGHDDGLKEKVARFVEKLGLDAVILHEQASEGKTIIEKIEKYSDVGYAIVLYTECDKGYDKNKPNEIKNRARQNVVFEHGYLIAKLGRERVCALVKGDVEKPGDISGVLYVSYDEKGAWKNEVAKEMKTVGCNVDLNNIL